MAKLQARAWSFFVHFSRLLAVCWPGAQVHETITFLLVTIHQIFTDFIFLSLTVFLSATVLSCRESSSHRRSGRDTDKTVLSRPAWRSLYGVSAIKHGEVSSPVNCINWLKTSLCSATYVRWYRGTARIRPSRLRHLLPTGPTAANMQQRVCCRGPSPCRDRQTDGTVPFHRPGRLRRRAVAM